MAFSPVCTLPFASNPDIDGIGIRVATYLQLFIGIITLAVSPRRAVDSWWAAIVTSLGLQIAAIVDYKQLSLYHALIVTWLAFPVLVMSSFYGFLSWTERLSYEIRLGISVHGVTYVAVNLWIWITAHSFGVQSECNDQVKFALFVLARPTGWIRYLVLYILGVWTLAIVVPSTVGVVFLCLRFAARFHPALRAWFDASPTPIFTRKPSLNAVVAALTALNLFSLVLSTCMVELMVSSNTDIVEGGNDKWTFGQVIAMILVAGPLVTLWKTVLEEMRHVKGDSLEHRPAAALLNIIKMKWGNMRTRGDDLERRVIVICF
ncbi:uncharacterized protein EV420DRAFT_1642538 [Desarmillaria tabescens]|uniref:Transmembrane protein n=1 Tax=Armillaria tabescens TaxID=1929756 RepID=A0AA39KDH9_ARMTA|nr:uncharacterized protein EV420DRAFT_1642538 [Desarmillaria tabescens]KAK0458813.1 hypothetical protein EV420DRAFT_1642538 [Desarmillaria tabescens]